MQIDFHFSATYVVARLSGFSAEDAGVISYASQYVDDSTTTGYLGFTNGMRYYREATAHPVLDPENLFNDVSTRSWLPFHFLPGNEGLDGRAPIADGDYERHLVCRQNSKVAQEMMRQVILSKGSPHTLHRLGIASHVFVDTFAHKGFVGLHNNLNNVESMHRLSDGQALKKTGSPPIGHGEANTFPDMPYLNWRYQNSDGEIIERNNPADFVLAADELFKWFRRYQNDQVVYEVAGLSDENKDKLIELFMATNDEDGESRNNRWLELINQNHFGFGAEAPLYIGKGSGSWKHQALGDEYLAWTERCLQNMAGKEDLMSKFQRFGASNLLNVLHKAEAMSSKVLSDAEPSIVYKDAEVFLASSYKKFHDAAAEQRYDIFMRVLPKFGIIAS